MSSSDAFLSTTSELLDNETEKINWSPIKTWSGFENEMLTFGPGAGFKRKKKKAAPATKAAQATKNHKRPDPPPLPREDMSSFLFFAVAGNFGGTSITPFDSGKEPYPFFLLVQIEFGL